MIAFNSFRDDITGEVFFVTNPYAIACLVSKAIALVTKLSSTKENTARQLREITKENFADRFSKRKENWIKCPYSQKGDYSGVADLGMLFFLSDEYQDTFQTDLVFLHLST